MKRTPELKKVLEISQKIDEGKPSKNTSKYPKWEYYIFNFKLGGKLFEGTVNIGIDKNVNKHFYEINKIHTTSNPHISADQFSSMNPINNNIPTSNNNVNTNNNSMQKNTNNTRFSIAGKRGMKNAIKQNTRILN